MLQKIKSLSLERQLFLSFSAVSALLLMLSLGITLYFDIARQSQSIDSTISSTAAYVASMDGVAEMLANGYPTQEVTGIPCTRIFLVLTSLLSMTEMVCAFTTPAAWRPARPL